MNKILKVLALAFSVQSMHDYHAESHFMCNTCHSVVQLSQAQDQEKLAALFDKFPVLNQYFPNEVPQMLSTQQYCEVLGLCGPQLVSDEELDLKTIAEQVNRANTTWQAEESTRFQKMTKSQIKKMMGTVVDPLWKSRAAVKSETNFLAVETPETFDSRVQWPQCASVIGHVRDQANCGSCWAHGTTEAYNDRLCIKTNGTFTSLLSTADTTGCCGANNCYSYGCDGGQIDTPWDWFQRTGVVTGGDFNDTQSCYPYTMPFCAHHVTGTGLPNCSDIPEVEPKCSKKCANGATYTADKHKALSSYALRSVDSIKRDILQYGPVTAAFTVYEDFVSYKTGVYRHTTGEALGGHAVKIIGWGTDHWIVINSWNQTWGDNGIFRIAFGECGIDEDSTAGQA